MASLKVRRMILTGAVVTITISGTLYGAQMKTNREYAAATQRTREATIDERLESLQGTRAKLSAKKELVDKQIRELDARVEDRKRKGIGGSKPESGGG